MDIRYPNEGLPKIPPFKFNFRILPFILIFFLLSISQTLFYEVGPDEVGVVQRFGKFVRTSGPGLHFKLPQFFYSSAIESVKKIKVTHVFKEEFGFRTATSGVRTVYVGRDPRTGADPFLEESLMLTGDLNVAEVQWILQYTVKDPVQYAFRVRDSRETIRNMCEAIMRLVVGDHKINEVLTSGRESIQMEVEKKLQEVLDSYQMGIDVRNIILQDVTPPDPVKPSFNEVNEAKQEKEKMINQAWEEYNRVVPAAKGEAEQTIREAEGYALERTNRAQGDAERFRLSYEAYSKAPEVTRQRMYLEALEKVLPGMKDKLILDDSQKGLLPLLHLDTSSEKKNI